jgi:hypothetical protein
MQTYKILSDRMRVSGSMVSLGGTQFRAQFTT